MFQPLSGGKQLYGEQIFRKIGDGPPDAIRNDQQVIAAYLGVAH